MALDPKAPASTAQTATENSAGFTSSAKALEDIIDTFKSGQLTLEEAMKLFEEGIGHLNVCQTALTESRGKVTVLLKTLREEGQIVTEPFGEPEN